LNSARLWEETIAACRQNASLRQYKTSAALRCGAVLGVEPSMRTIKVSVDGVAEAIAT
jgi:hypothetical protein